MVDDGRIAADHPTRLQPVDPSLYCRSRKPDVLADVAKGPACVLLQQSDDPGVNRVYVAHGAHLRNIMTVTPRLCVYLLHIERWLWCMCCATFACCLSSPYGRHGPVERRRRLHAGRPRGP